MTIAIGLLTREGIVLGADSTATVSMQNPNPGAAPLVVQLFNSAQKIFEIGPRLDTFVPGRTFSGAFVTYGDGSFGPVSWRDFVTEFYYKSEPTMRWDDNLPTLFRDFGNRKWQELIASGDVAARSPMPDAGAIIAAVSRGAINPHGATVNWRTGAVDQLPPFIPMLGGDISTVKRTIEGFDPGLRAALTQPGAGLTEAQFDAVAGNFCLTIFSQHMPLRDAIDFVHFLIYSTIKMHRYRGAAALVGGPIEIAAITSDRGFRWILHKPLSESISAAQPNLLA